MEAMVSKPTKTLSGGHRPPPQLSLYGISILRRDPQSGCYGRAQWNGLRSGIHARCFIPGLGRRGQRRLAQGHVAVVGCGATGAAAAALLARAGVGALTLVDRDFVEESNLQRQVLFDEADAREALPKAEAARRKIAQFNSRTEVHAHVADLVPSNIHALLGGAAILLDATDNFETRYLLNDYAIEQSRPWIYAAAVGAYAATMNILPGETACLACLFPTPPAGMVETCETAGILNTAVNFAASVEVTEALKFLVGAQDKMRRTLLAEIYGPTTRPRSAPPHPGPSVRSASRGILPICEEKTVLRSRCAGEIRCRSMNIIARLTLPRCNGGWNRMAR